MSDVVALHEEALLTVERLDNLLRGAGQQLGQLVDAAKVNPIVPGELGSASANYDGAAGQLAEGVSQVTAAMQGGTQLAVQSGQNLIEGDRGSARAFATVNGVEAPVNLTIKT